MKARKQLLAAGSTATLVVGGVFFGASPASAVHDSPECLSAQSQFTAALHNVELNAELEVQLSVALQNLIDAQETLDLLIAEGTLTVAEVEALIASALVDAQLTIPELLAVQALVNAEATADAVVADAQAALALETDASLDQATLDALVTAGIDPALFLIDPLLNEVELTAAVEAAVAVGLPPGVDQAEVDALILDINNGDEELTDASLATLVELGINLSDFQTTQHDLTAIAVALDAVVTVSEQEATLALLAALESGDVVAILEAEAVLEALVGDIVDLTVLADPYLELLAAQAILQAEANLNAAITVVDDLLIQLDALDIDLSELEALFAAAIKACSGAGAVVGDGDGDDDNDHDYAGGGGAGGGGAVTTGGNTGGANRGMNVQTAVPTASTDPAGIGALAAGVGFMVVAGTLAARRVRNS